MTNREFQKGMIEFVVDQSKLNNNSQNIFIIKKQYRKDKTNVIPISYYYVYKGIIYQSPNFSSVVTNNIQIVTNDLLDILDDL